MRDLIIILQLVVAQLILIFLRAYGIVDWSWIVIFMPLGELVILLPIMKLFEED